MKNNCVVFILSQITFFLQLLCIILLFVLNNNQDYDFSYLKSLSWNWNSSYVEEIFSGYDNIDKYCYPMINDRWNGTVGGCKFENTPSRDCENGGSILATISPKYYYYWRDIKMCSRRSFGTYFDLTLAKNASSCPEGFRSCGIADSLSNVLCRPLNATCPSNYLQIIPFDQPFPSGFNFQNIQANQANIIVSNTNTKGNILVDFKISEGQPCINPMLRSNNGSLYVLEGDYSNPGCAKNITQQDKHYQLIDSYSYFAVYYQNKILSAMNNLPEFPNYEFQLVSSDRKFGLYSKKYDGITVECYDFIKSNNFSSQFIFEISNLDYQVQSFASTYLWGSILASMKSLGSIVFMVSIWITSCKDGVVKIDKQSFFYFYRISAVCLILIVSIGGYILSQFLQMGTTFDILITSNCPNEEAVNSLRNFYNLKQKSVIILTIITTASSICVLIISILFICLFIK